MRLSRQNKFDGKCHGLPECFQQSALSQLGHQCVALECSDNSFILVCAKCGQYSTGGQMRGLKQLCQKPKDKMPRRLNDIRKGRHPKRAGTTVEVGSWLVFGISMEFWTS